jgi:hypothetical protein
MQTDFVNDLLGCSTEEGVRLLFSYEFPTCLRSKSSSLMGFLSWFLTSALRVGLVMRTYVKSYPVSRV